MSRRPSIRRRVRTADPRRQDYRPLIRAARAARARAYAPYSRFSVGAAALTSDGSIYAGANVENASYGLTQCAERVAMQTAVADGRRRIVAVAIVGAAGISPCGACRQVMAEFGVRAVVIAAAGTTPAVVAFADLLPRPFGPRNLRARRAGTTARTRPSPARHDRHAGL